MEHVKALFFDVFGTLVDWRGSIAREARIILSPRGVAIDWEGFADAWRGQYQPAMDEVRSGRLPFSKLDVLHRRNLDVILKDLGLEDLDESTRANLNLAWHRLDAWPDTRPGLARLRAKFWIAPCSNGNISLMVDLARRNGLVWDAILDCEPRETMMVAAHSSDLAAAAATGLRTAFIARPNEHGEAKGESRASVPVDLSAASLTALADQLACA